MTTRHEGIGRPRKLALFFIPFLAILVVGGLMGLHAQSPSHSLLIPREVQLTTDVEFGKGGNRALKMDILKPSEQPKSPMPVVVFIHGGGWRGGNRQSGRPLLIPLAKSGYFCATIEYRLTGEATFPAQIEDCKCAIRFLRSKAKEYNIDPDRIGVWGSSAGGHLVALLGTSGGVKDLEGKGGSEKYSSRVQAVCDWFGPSDLSALAERAEDFPRAMRMQAKNGKDPVSLLVGGPFTEKKDACRRASPVTYITRDDPPFLIMHGDKDTTVPLSQSKILNDKLKAAGVSSTLYVVKGGDHGFKGRTDSADLTKMVTDFFDKELRAGSRR